MRLAFTFLLLSPAAFAAPVPKGPEKPRVVLALKSVSADGPSLLGGCIELSMTNADTKPLTLAYAHLPISAFEFEVRDEKGDLVPYKHPITLVSPGRPAEKTLELKAGDSTKLRLGLDRWQFENESRPAGKLAVVARLKHDGTVYESKPLVVGE